MSRLDSLWRPLKIVSSELGEDPIQIAKSVHPTLETIEQNLTGLNKKPDHLYKAIRRNWIV